METCIKLYNEETVRNNGKDLKSKIQEKLFCNETAFFHIDYKLDFYLGNTGSALKYLGNIKDLSSNEILNHILSAKDNYYETSSIHYEDIINAVKREDWKGSKENYVYPSDISAIVAMIKNNSLL